MSYSDVLTVGREQEVRGGCCLSHPLNVDNPFANFCTLQVIKFWHVALESRVSAVLDVITLQLTEK